MSDAESSKIRGAAVAPANGLPGATLRRVVEHIDANAHRAPRLSELSALAHMSTFHFARLFKRSTGLSPHRFVVGRRIDHAKVLLAADDLSIAAISRAAGFRTPSHFTTVFRRAAGMTPSAYRSAAHSAPPNATAPPAPGAVAPGGAVAPSVGQERRSA
jgi:AraC family transcriptional regulator